MHLSSKEIGSGYPVVLVHGFCEDQSIWDNFLPSLAIDNKVICIDLPGFGSSTIVPETTIESVAALVYDHLKSKDIFECIMIGHSLGGYVTLAIENQYPHFLKGFGLFHSTALADTEEKKVGRNKTIESVKIYGKAAFLKTFVPSLYNQDRLSEYTEAIQKSEKLGESTSEETIIAYTQAMRDRADRLHLLKASQKPILFIAGEKDNAITVDKSLLHKPYIQASNYHLLKDVGHMGFYEEPDQCLLLIQNFLKRV